MKQLPELCIPETFKIFPYDTLKIEHQAHGFKTNDPLINTENDENLILKSGMKLYKQGITDQTEVSFFRLADYRTYVAEKKTNEVVMG